MEILKRSKAWFYLLKNCLFHKDRIKFEFNNLAAIADKGSLSSIYYLLYALKARNGKIRNRACRIIVMLFDNIKIKKTFNDELKPCDISLSDIDYFQALFPEDQYFVLLAISSLNHNGYVREKAVKRLSNVDNPRAIQFLAYRLSDWVLPVRKAALEGIKSYRSAKYIDQIVENLPILVDGMKSRRLESGDVFQDFIDFVLIGSKDYVYENFSKYPDRLRLILAKQISLTIKDNSKEIQLLLSDRHFLIRRLAVDHFDKLDEIAIEKLLKDRTARIRLYTLYHLKNRIDFSSILRNYLADNSSDIRYFARYWLKDSNLDFAHIYYSNLTEGKQVVGSIFGLAEVDAKQHSLLLSKFLNQKNIKIRKASFLALTKLDKETAYKFALKNLDSESRGVRKIAIEFLSSLHGERILTKAREVYNNGNFELKISMLQIFNSIGGWEALPDLINATIDENRNVSRRAVEYIEYWKKNIVSLFIKPSKIQLERIEEVYYTAYKIHGNQHIFETNPLEGLDYYFK